jgi:hypothetical protein
MRVRVSRPGKLAFDPVGGTFKLGAHTPAELDAIDGWVIDAWLRTPVQPPSPEGVLALSLEQAPDRAGTETPAGLPRPRNHRGTAWYEQYEQPAVACTLVVRHVEEVLRAPDEDLWLSSGIEFDGGSGILSIDQETVQVRVSALDLDLEATPEIVRWIRRRFWKIGPLEFESGG